MARRRMKTATPGSPTEVESLNAETDADTAPEQSNEAVSQGAQALTGEAKFRAILRGEITDEEDAGDGKAKSNASEDADAIAAQFDPETGEFLEQEPGNDSADTASPDRTGEKDPEENDESEDHDGDQAEEDDDEDEEEAGKARTPAKGKENAEPGQKKRIAIKRGRLSDQDFAIVQLADREQIPLDEAKRRLFGDAPQRKENDETATREETNAEPEVTPDSIQAKIDGLLAERKKATQALDVEKATELSDEISDLKLQKRDLQQQKSAREQTAAQRLQSGVVESVTKAVGMFPDSGKEGSELFKAIDAERLARRETDPGFFNKPNWPVLLAIEVASDMGIAPVAAAPTPKGGKPAKPATPAAAAPKKPARPAPPNPAPGNTTGANQNTEAALVKELATAKASRNPEAIMRVMRKIEQLDTSGKR